MLLARIATTLTAAMLLVISAGPADAANDPAMLHDHAVRTQADFDALVTATRALLYDDPLLPAGCVPPWQGPAHTGHERSMRTKITAWLTPVATATSTITLRVIVDDEVAETTVTEVDWRQPAPGAPWQLTTPICPDLEPAPDWFADDNGNPHEPAINRLARRGIISGYEDGTFRPDRNISSRQADALVRRALDAAEASPGAGAAVATRTDVARLLADALTGTPADVSATSPFIDVAMSHPDYRPIAMLAAAGVLTGYPDGSFRPDEPVTRGQMATMLVRALDRVDR